MDLSCVGFNLSNRKGVRRRKGQKGAESFILVMDGQQVWSVDVHQEKGSGLGHLREDSLEVSIDVEEE